MALIYSALPTYLINTQILVSLWHNNGTSEDSHSMWIDDDDDDDENGTMPRMLS